MARDSSPGPSASEMRRHCTFRRIRANAKFSPLGPAPTMRTGFGAIVSAYCRHERTVQSCYFEALRSGLRFESARAYHIFQYFREIFPEPTDTSHAFLHV